MKTKLSIAVIVFAVLAANAAPTSFTSTGWVSGAPVPGVWCTNGQGQVSVRSLVHAARVQSTDPRLTGHRLITVNGGYNADGTATLQGTSYHQVGTWDPTATNFTPAGGVWEITYQGVMQTDNSLLLHLAGYGTGGTIDGLRLNETMTRAATTNVLDPTVPYLYTGTIQPPPGETVLLQDGFDGAEAGWLKYGPEGSYVYTRYNGQLLISGHWPGVVTRNVVDTYTFGGPGTFTWSAADGQTVEVRAELASFNQAATAVRLVLGTFTGFYSLFKGHDFVALSKWSETLPWGPVIMFFYEQRQVPDSNVVLVLAVTKANEDVVITAKVLAKDSSNTVLYTKSYVDTPNADPTLTTAELLGLSGMNLTLTPDFAGAPVTGGQAAIGVWQYNYDGNQPTALATFDSLKVPKYDVPQIGVERAVRLSWPGLSGVNWGVEAAPALLGPWFQLQPLDLPGMSQMCVPAGSPAQFFRLVPAP